MPKVTFITRDGTSREFEVPVGLSLLEVAHKNDIDIEGACEGSLACSTCHVVVEPEWYDVLPEATEDEEDMLDLAFGLTRTSRLGCQIIVSEELDGLTVRLPSATRNMQKADHAEMEHAGFTGINLPRGARVVAAMSGGVDSSVVAAILAEQGFEVIGATLRLYDDGAIRGKTGSCCAGADIADARAVADRIGIPHYVLDYESRFRDSVIDAFADSYLRGETPIPCVRCNQTVKFSDLLEMARTLGADALATGHYVRRTNGPSGPELRRGADMSRDQSYFLFATTPEQLDYLRFPLGDLPKSRVRELALQYGLRVADKPDSQDICFVPTGSYADVVSKLRPEAARPGQIVDLSGQILGQHQGIIHYTIGQRKGLGIAHSEPLYVVGLNPVEAQVIVGPKEALARDRVFLDEMNWLIQVDAHVPFSADVKLRSAQPLASARITPLANGSAMVDLDGAVLGVAPGQACVIYQDDRVLGGGWIKATERRQIAA